VISLKCPKNAVSVGKLQNLSQDFIGTGFTYLALVAVLIIGFELPLNYTFGILILFAMLCYIPTIRLARSLWIHMNVKYDKKYN